MRDDDREERWRKMSNDIDPTRLRRGLRVAFERPGLPGPHRLLILTGGATTKGGEETLATFFEEALDLGAPLGDLREVVLQTYLFAGYPRAINALFALRQAATPERYGATPREVDPAERRTDHAKRGEDLARIVYGDHYSDLRRNIAALHPDLDRWMVEEGYGRVLGRPGLDARIRELAALTSLIVLDVPRQIRSHLLGARHVGASDGAIEETIHQAGLFASDAGCEAAAQIWTDLR